MLYFQTSGKKCAIQLAYHSLFSYSIISPAWAISSFTVTIRFCGQAIYISCFNKISQAIESRYRTMSFPHACEVANNTAIKLRYSFMNKCFNKFWQTPPCRVTENAHFTGMAVGRLFNIGNHLSFSANHFDQRSGMASGNHSLFELAVQTQNDAL